MRLELAIDRLQVPGIPAHARDDLARAIEEELDRLIRSRGLPYGQEVGEIEIDRAALAVAPGASVAEVASSIARQLVAGLYRQASGRVPADLREPTEGGR
jgi:hypothetical protein